MIEEKRDAAAARKAQKQEKSRTDKQAKAKIQKEQRSNGAQMARDRVSRGRPTPRQAGCCPQGGSREPIRHSGAGKVEPDPRRRQRCLQHPQKGLPRLSKGSGRPPTRRRPSRHAAGLSRALPAGNVVSLSKNHSERALAKNSDYLTRLFFNL